MFRLACRAMLALLYLSGATACIASPDVALHDAFGAERPAPVTVRHYDSAIVHPDGWDVWVLEPVDDAFVRRVVETARLERSPDTSAVTGLVSGWPSWWDPARIEALPEAWSRDTDDEHWRLWVDRRQNRMYLQWFGT